VVEVLRVIDPLQRLDAGGVVTFPAGVMHAVIAGQPSVADTVFNLADAQKELL
jgi:quercetin dioxygenase-like cupin family protein